MLSALSPIFSAAGDGSVCVSRHRLLALWLGPVSRRGTGRTARGECERRPGAPRRARHAAAYFAARARW
eukprot:15440529-Alexandrium_andersonii.AAC.1